MQGRAGGDASGMGTRPAQERLLRAMREWTGLPYDATSTSMRGWAKCVFEYCEMGRIEAVAR